MWRHCGAVDGQREAHLPRVAGPLDSTAAPLLAPARRALPRAFPLLSPDHGENHLAGEVAEEGGEFFGDDIALILTRALATARSGAPRAAQELLASKQPVLAGAEEAKLLARTFKESVEILGRRTLPGRVLRALPSRLHDYEGSSASPG